MPQVFCSICTRACFPCVPIHINDRGNEITPNPLHPSSPMCVECLQTQWDVDNPCSIWFKLFVKKFINVNSISKQRFLEPTPPQVCSVKFERKKKGQLTCSCGDPATKVGIDGNPYCDKHEQTGPFLIQVYEGRKQVKQEEKKARQIKRTSFRFKS
jgi:hypothetical protein